MSAVTQEWKKIKHSIELSCKKAKRDVKDVHLIAVSKTFGKDDIVPILEVGQRAFGENRVQEAKEKWPQLRAEYHDIQLHCIGPLQSNKAPEAVALFDVIQTIDREKIAKVLSEEMQRQKRFLPCYVQVNTGLEPQKAGIDPRETKKFVETCRTTYRLTIIGLMCIPPLDDNPGPHFALLQKLAKENDLTELSMGMSADFETAIAFGATQVRVGSAIFGGRAVSHI
ncbi:YggS family pyridoxal phosphate-dependent enzyme [Bartonella tamiae]|uniref:Pyridoxal phosphate homeostasis protein n=1 Tax=Bartonella tamiae Th239 TaxID=1094558 RepID=J1K218_9HYPH|nr:YggS family pyridoxal phosphate-dependent enzyme [Bartonella tamiae]EJF91492.1 YggS family pyridoxal phosphate enzyme [Bartonella tamiae Th239]EJF92524.1 YggS family pyridoxal phosphate enzyme [Bartonella tamiae Th307]